MKTEKVARAEVIAFYAGGAKVHATTTYTKVELETRMEEAMTNNPIGFVKIDTVNQDPEVADDSLTLLFDKLLFYTVFEKNDSKIITPPSSGKIEVVS